MTDVVLYVEPCPSPKTKPGIRQLGWPRRYAEKVLQHATCGVRGREGGKGGRGYIMWSAERVESKREAK